MTPSHSQSLGLDASSEQHQAVLKQVCVEVNEFSVSSPQSRVKIMSQVMRAKDHEEASINILRWRLTQWLWKQMCLQNQKEKNETEGGGWLTWGSAGLRVIAASGDVVIPLVSVNQVRFVVLFVIFLPRST